MDSNEHVWHESPEAHEVTAKYELIIGWLVEAHQDYARPLHRGEPIVRRTFGACRHLRDEIQAAYRDDVPMVPAHIWSNTSFGVRLCQWCSDRAANVERYTCGLCGLDNPYRVGHYRDRDRACAMNLILLPPLELHLPLCRRCERIVAEHQQSTVNAA